jgi:hypothetical protein
MATGFLFSAEAAVTILNTHRPSLGPTVPPIHWDPGGVFSGVRHVKLVIYLYVIPSLRISRSLPPLPTRLHRMMLKHKDVAEDVTPREKQEVGFPLLTGEISGEETTLEIQMEE